MNTKKQKIRSATGRLVDSETVKFSNEDNTLKPDDVVVIIHADDYKRSFEKMMNRISEMDEKINDQSKLLNENIVEEKSFLGRFRKRETKDKD